MIIFNEFSKYLGPCRVDLKVSFKISFRVKTSFSLGEHVQGEEKLNKYYFEGSTDSVPKLDLGC